MDADKRGRNLVWSSGSPDAPAGDRRRRIRDRIIALATLCGAIAALASVLVVIAPSGVPSSPGEPLWQPTRPITSTPNDASVTRSRASSPAAEPSADDDRSRHSGSDDGVSQHSGTDDGTSGHSRSDDRAPRHSGSDDGASHSGSDDGTSGHSGSDDSTSGHSGSDDSTTYAGRDGSGSSSGESGDDHHRGGGSSGHGGSGRG